MILVDGTWKRTYQNAIGRWAGIGPYYAMFPNEFAFDAISRFTRPGDWILDPFAGRFSSIFAAASQKRNGVGIEINPVGWVYGQAKLNPASKEDVQLRLKEVNNRARYFGSRSCQKMPEFFLHCFSPQVLSFLLAARQDLDWQNDRTDTTLMALILVYLHAKLGGGLSNQMRQSKAMAPDYSVRWWIERNMRPPHICPLKFMTRKIQWRYHQGRPNETGAGGEGKAILADSTKELKRIVHNVEHGIQPRFNLILTSPPYYDVTHYHHDQWLRYWMLGGPNRPGITKNKYKGRFSSRAGYQKLLDSVFERTAQVVSDNAIVYIRTDKRNFTLETTRNSLRKHFPNWQMEESVQPVTGHTQTALFGDFSPKPGEVDIVMRPS